MTESFFEKPARLGHLLQNIVRRKGLAEQSSGGELQQLWKITAGERVSAKSFVKRLRGGVLEVNVTSGVILEELNGYLQHDILTALQQQHPDPEIKSLRFIRVRSR